SLTIRDPSLDLCALLVIVPGSNEQERNGAFRIVVPMKYFQCVFKSLAAAPVHVPIQTPRCTGIVEARPNSTHHDLARSPLRLLVKALQVFLAPITAFRVPCFPRMDPGVVAVEIPVILWRGVILV